MPDTEQLLSTTRRVRDAIPESRGLSWSAGLYQSIVLDALGRLTKGSLTMTLPDGNVILFGHPGKEVQAFIEVRHAAFFKKCVLYGDVGFGESYVDGDWTTENLTDVIRWMILNVEDHPAMSGSKKPSLLINWLQRLNKTKHLLQSNSRSGSRRNIRAHYDLSNDFFGLFLDSSMTYSSAFFREANQPLAEAQREKYDRLCRKLKIQPADHVLEIGSGWGGFALYAASQYGCRVTGLTISQEQYHYSCQKIRDAGLSHRVDIQLKDYRDLQGSYDKIVSIEMLEAVGHDFLPIFFRKCHDVLKSDGVLGLQVITCADHRYEHLRKGVDWVQKHIFPGSLLPSVSAIQQAINKTGNLVLHHTEDLAPHYALTLASWRDALMSRRANVLDLGFDDAFLRKWDYYFSYCEAAFAMRHIAVHQMVFSRPTNWRF